MQPCTCTVPCRFWMALGGESESLMRVIRMWSSLRPQRKWCYFLRVLQSVRTSQASGDTCCIGWHKQHKTPQWTFRNGLTHLKTNLGSIGNLLDLCCATCSHALLQACTFLHFAYTEGKRFQLKNVTYNSKWQSYLASSTSFLGLYSSQAN